jgi:hypothetical protein
LTTSYGQVFDQQLVVPISVQGQASGISPTHCLATRYKVWETRRKTLTPTYRGKRKYARDRWARVRTSQPGMCRQSCVTVSRRSGQGIPLAHDPPPPMPCVCLSWPPRYCQLLYSMEKSITDGTGRLVGGFRRGRVSQKQGWQGRVSVDVLKAGGVIGGRPSSVPVPSR